MLMKLNADHVLLGGEILDARDIAIYCNNNICVLCFQLHNQIYRISQMYQIYQE